VQGTFDATQENKSSARLNSHESIEVFGSENNIA